jgi:hypothetical protein
MNIFVGAVMAGNCDEAQKEVFKHFFHQQTNKIRKRMNNP